ncbi:MAG: YqhA family protein [Xanthobacteraceae bacterium]|nr:YqhA family protein [Xanthobacteraceae bacterium]QYK44580.1 MAG: YqhA family protein [Xanthobacteraceae bacterium]HMN50802.1 YqhA family protein [Xanthobacteraceae bacterium]
MAAPRKQKLPLQNDIDWRLALKERPFLGTFVLFARGTMLIAIVATFVIATALLIYALFEVYEAVKLLLTTKSDGKKLTLAAIEAVDTFLLVTVLHIVAIGLYQLYIQDEIPVPKWVKVETIDDLKTTLSGVVILVLAVFFLGRTIIGEASQNLLLMGGGIGAVILALTVFMFMQHHKKQSEK